METRKMGVRIGAAMVGESRLEFKRENWRLKLSSELTAGCGESSEDKYKPPCIKILERKVQIEAIGR